MGKKLIIKGADFSVNGIISREKIVLIKDTYVKTTGELITLNNNESGWGFNWYTTGRLIKKHNTYRLEGVDGAQARLIKIKDNSVIENPIITLPITLDLSNADEFALNFALVGSNPETSAQRIDENLLDDIFLYPI